MRRASRATALVGILALGVGAPAWAFHDGYHPPPSAGDPYGGYPAYPRSYVGGYGNPAPPYGGGYPGGYGVGAAPYGPYPGGYGLPPGSPYGPGGPSVYSRGYFPPGGPAPGHAAVADLAAQLAAQADEFVRAFVHDADRVPQGAQFLADATVLRDAAARFSQVAAGGAPPPVLAREFDVVASSWRRLESRMAVVSRGRIGPNIATALQMGQTVAQIGRLLP